MKQFDDMRLAAVAFWRQRSPKERVQLGVGAALAVLLLLVFSILLPLQEARQRLMKIVAREQVRTASMVAISAELGKLGALPRAEEVAAGEVLRSSVEASARATFSPAVVVVAQEGGNLRMHAAGVPFDQVVTWIDAIRQKQRLRLVNASIRPDPGVTCTVSLLFSGVSQ